MGLFKQKEKTSLKEAFADIAAAGLRAPALDYSLVDTKGVLSKSEKARLTEEIPYLKFALASLHMMDLQRRGKIEGLKPRQVDDEQANHALGEAAGFGITVAYAGVLGKGKKAETAAKKAQDAHFDYINSLSELEGKKVKAYEPYFKVVDHFSKKVLGDIKPKDKDFPDRSFTVFEIGKQIHQHIEGFFKKMSKEVQFTVEESSEGG